MEPRCVEIVTNFEQGEVEISTINVNGNTWTTENCTIAQYTGPGFEPYFQDEKFFRFIDGVDSVSGLGEAGNSYVKMSVCPSKVGTDMFVRFAFAKEVKVEDIANITIRAYLKLNATETSETSIQRSIILPFSSTIITSEFLTVESLCAITNTVLPCISRSIPR